MKLTVALYALLAVIGAVLPLSAFLPWLMEHGLNIPLFLSELFSTRVGAFFGWDVIVSAVVLITFIVIESRRRKIAHAWIPIVCCLSIGVSFGLPIFLAMREAYENRT